MQLHDAYLYNKQAKIDYAQKTANLRQQYLKLKGASEQQAVYLHKLHLDMKDEQEKFAKKFKYQDKKYFLQIQNNEKLKQELDLVHQ